MLPRGLRILNAGLKRCRAPNINATARQCIRYASKRTDTSATRPPERIPTGPSAKSPRLPIIRRISSLLSRGYTAVIKDPAVQRLAQVGPLRITCWVSGAFLLFHIFTSYFYTINPTWGISMVPTLNSSGEWVLISKYYRRGREVEVGDLVSFSHPADEDVQAIKRVAGLEGDFVGMGPGFISDKGKRIGEARAGMMIQVPRGHCWVVGDNLQHSRDSRLFGPIPLALIKGKIIARYAPPFTLQWIENGLQDSNDEDDVD